MRWVIFVINLCQCKFQQISTMSRNRRRPGNAFYKSPKHQSKRNWFSTLLCSASTFLLLSCLSCWLLSFAIRTPVGRMRSSFFLKTKIEIMKKLSYAFMLFDFQTKPPMSKFCSVCLASISMIWSDNPKRTLKSFFL